MKRASLLLTSAFLLSACATGGGSVMDGIMASWEGASVDQVIRQWGYPHSEREVAGRRLLYWQRDTQLIMPGSTSGTATRVGSAVYYNQTTAAPALSNWSCVRILEVKADHVVGWQHEGNNCPFMEVGPYSNWRRK